MSSTTASLTCSAFGTANVYVNALSYPLVQTIITKVEPVTMPTPSAPSAQTRFYTTPDASATGFEFAVGTSVAVTNVQEGVVVIQSLPLPVLAKDPALPSLSFEVAIEWPYTWGTSAVDLTRRASVSWTRTQPANNPVLSTNTANSTMCLATDSLTSLTSGSGNTVIGQQILTGSALSSYNTAIGYEALKNNQHVNTVAIGSSAGKNAQGCNNVFIGYNADHSGVSTNRVVIGANADGFNKQINNAIYLGNGNTLWFNSPLIVVDAPILIGGWPAYQKANCGYRLLPNSNMAPWTCDYYPDEIVTGFEQKWGGADTADITKVPHGSWLCYRDQYSYLSQVDYHSASWIVKKLPPEEYNIPFYLTRYEMKINANFNIARPNHIGVQIIQEFCTFTPRHSTLSFASSSLNFGADILNGSGADEFYAQVVILNCRQGEANRTQFYLSDPADTYLRPPGQPNVPIYWAGPIQQVGRAGGWKDLYQGPDPAKDPWTLTLKVKIGSPLTIAVRLWTTDKYPTDDTVGIVTPKYVANNGKGFEGAKLFGCTGGWSGVLGTSPQFRRFPFTRR